MAAVHPLYEKLLDRFCAETAIDARAVREMIAGDRAADPITVSVFSDALGVPRSAWKKRTKASSLVTPLPGRHRTGMAEVQAVLSNPPVNNRRRKPPTAVHRALDRLGWSMATLADAVSKELGRRISRPSMQNYAVGQRSVTHRGNGAPRMDKVTAPVDVRDAAERVTLREAQKRKLGDDAVLRASAWPNV